MSHPSTLQLIRQQSIDHQLIYMIFHRLVNEGDVAQALDEPTTTLDHFFKLGMSYCFSLREDDLSSVINLTPPPYHLALLQNMFCAALVLGNASVLKVVLNIDRVGLAHRPLPLAGPHRYPLEFAVYKGHLQATQTLLDHGVDPNRDKNPFLLPSIWAWHSMKQQNSAAKVGIVRLLINSGVELDPRFAAGRMSHCDKSELLLLVDQCLDKSFKTFFQQGGLPRFLGRNDWDDSFSTALESILDRAFSDGINQQNVWNSVLSQSLSWAVLRSHTSAVGILLTRQVQPDVRCLVSAVQSQNLGIFEDFLNHGLDPNARVPPHRNGNFHQGFHQDLSGTALSESIKDPSRGAFRILKAQGFIPKLVQQPAGFAPSLLAACEVGDSLLVEELLALQICLRRQANIQNALLAAIRGNHHDITRKLLSAGIKPTTSSIIVAIQNRQLAVVKQLIRYLDPREVLLADAYADQVIILEALRWGDQTVIQYVLRAGHPVNIHGTIPTRKLEDWSIPPKLRPIYFKGWIVTPLSTAILKGNPTAVEALLARGANYCPVSRTSNRYDLTPLAAGAVRNNLPLLKELLRIGAEPFDNCALLVSAVLEREDVITLLLSAIRTRYPAEHEILARTHSPIS
jgi:ankyrin repeat protein